jgi:hypothetical protein
MNREIHNKELTTRSDNGSKAHQAYAQELSRLRHPENGDPSYEACINSKNDSSRNPNCGRIISRYNEIEPLVGKERDKNKSEKTSRMNAGENNQFQKPLDPTEVSAPNVTKDGDHSGKSVTNKIMSNDQALKSKKPESKVLTNKEALSEEISNIRYLIEYMNNNNNKQII